ncbi:MYND-type domain-containing protein [Mycena indigotica]|uniref:MYND-type domain-containing protein n=1 Tax=Mycena indigotica TaxID=2126181 RepID=A0A8H6SYJ0_9AGAR|nr:MYND-type domain-containing protein [Mycena indigotica]KAF7306265.1 MYND-type domain-containing protein [Mycena indigotica]
MARPLTFRNRAFHPISDSGPATSLLRDVAPEPSVNILALGCGDIRNVLYTIYSESKNLNRKLDFTFCDIEPAVLSKTSQLALAFLKYFTARNIILLTMILDNVDIDTIWNLFLHIYIDQKTLDGLVLHCNKLLQLSTHNDWAASDYGKSIHIGSEHTFDEFRLHLVLYTQMNDLPVTRLAALKADFKELSHSEAAVILQTVTLYPKEVSDTCFDLFKAYWTVGTTFSDPTDISAATLLNPTFVYSAAGQAAQISPTTNPISPFHFTELFVKGKPTVREMLETAKAQLVAWSSAFRVAIQSHDSSLVIRFITSDALALCRTIASGKSTISLPVSQWRSGVVQLDHDLPSSFHVVDTSSISDHLGILNILAVAIPLLPEDGVLYTDTVIPVGGKLEVAKEFIELLHGDVDTMSFLFGVHPVDHLSGFSSRTFTISGRGFAQFTTWKRPASVDSIAGSVPVIWDGRMLGRLLFGLYNRIFSLEDTIDWTNFRINHQAFKRSLKLGNRLPYTRESFVLMLQSIRGNFCIPDSTWTLVMEEFCNQPRSFGFDNASINEFKALLHVKGLYSHPALNTNPPQRVGPFASWIEVPLVVRIYLVVPLEKVQIVRQLAENTSDPLFQCRVHDAVSASMFNSVDAFFGTIEDIGTESQPMVIPQPGPFGSSPFVLSFLICAADLHRDNLHVSFHPRHSFGSLQYSFSLLGPHQEIFSAKLSDKRHVHIVPYDYWLPKMSNSLSSTAQITRPVLDDKCESLRGLSTQIQITDHDAQRLALGIVPEVLQTSPRSLKVSIEDHSYDAHFPVPVRGSFSKVTRRQDLAHIQLFVPPSRALPDFGLHGNPFPTVGHQSGLHSWNLSRLNLSQCPSIGVSDSTTTWCENRFTRMVSKRELSSQQSTDIPAFIKAKGLLGFILSSTSGVNRNTSSKIFEISEAETDKLKLVVLVDGLKLDLPSDSFFADVYVLDVEQASHGQLGPAAGQGEALSVYNKLKATTLSNLTPLPLSMRKHDLIMWKQMIQALTECSRSWTHLPYCIAQERHKACNCGRGQDVAAVKENPKWAPLAPFLTRVALPIIFPVPVLEAMESCSVCEEGGKPNLLRCSRCTRVFYCSQECQRKDWKEHKPDCKA